MRGLDWLIAAPGLWEQKATFKPFSDIPASELCYFILACDWKKLSEHSCLHILQLQQWGGFLCLSSAFIFLLFAVCFGVTDSSGSIHSPMLHQRWWFMALSALLTGLQKLMLPSAVWLWEGMLHWSLLSANRISDILTDHVCCAHQE